MTADREGAAAKIDRTVSTLTVEDALQTPFVALGTHAEIAEYLRACRSRRGISYLSVREIESSVPVITYLNDVTPTTQ